MLDGAISELFGEVFGALYLDGTLDTGLAQPIYDTEGNITGYAGGDNVPIKVQTDAASYAMRQQEGFAEGDAMLIVLGQGIGDVTTDHEVVDGYGVRWKVQSADQDAARSHWVLRGRRGN
ncbi:MAG: hypothetical protein ACRCVX_12440 [Shewanella sp.]